MVFDDPAAAREVRRGSRRIGEARFQAALSHQRAVYLRLYACSSSMAICGVAAEDLLEGIEARGLTAFLLEEVAGADRVLTF